MKVAKEVNIEILNLLVSYGADPLADDCNAVIIASKNKNIDFFENLLKRLIKLNLNKDLLLAHSDFSLSNLLFKKNKLVGIIDFENLFNTTEMTPLTRIYWDKFRRVWFGDVLDKNEIDLIYKNLPTFSIDQSKMLDADLFEKNYFNKKKIDTRSHLDFLELTANFEKRHVLAKNIVYGHRLGLYLSDFHSSDDESKVYLAMRDFSSKDWDGFLLELQKAVDTEQQNYLISIYTNKKRTDEVCEVLNKVKGK